MVKISILLRRGDNRIITEHYFEEIVPQVVSDLQDYLYDNYEEIGVMDEYEYNKELVEPELNRIIINVKIPQIDNFNPNHFTDWFNNNRVPYAGQPIAEIPFIIETTILQEAGIRRHSSKRKPNSTKRKSSKRRTSGGKRRNSKRTSNRKRI
jgi:hypothetical protein